ncbi:MULTISPECIES: DUF551 domain-containing protein [unclassified Psychrobacter]|uniref:DUF551 domain-containing protein n=1 Tax=unclassified Psychrobacter TaxID=196806 RepID=UPI0025EF8385|nr:MULTISPECIES: DUF551 domain-containing protein [unclassified Psychrobacter]
MNNLPLQPLKWSQNNYAEIVTHTAKSPLHDYTIRYDDLEGAYLIDYYERMTNEHGNEFFKSVDEAKNWAQSTHYKDKMQPYIKPSPTWISVKDKLPTHHQDVIVYRYDGEQSSIEHSLYFDGEVMKGFGNVADEEGFFDDVYYWQPIETKALYEAMAMQLQISEAADD